MLKERHISSSDLQVFDSERS